MTTCDEGLAAPIVRMVDADVELVASILDRAEREGLPVSLETLREMNVSYYRRFGFEVAAEGRLAGSGPTFWVMRRRPACGRRSRPVREKGA